MLTRTILAEAHNAGAATRYAVNGVECVRVVERATARKTICGPMAGKVIWLTTPSSAVVLHPP